MNINFPLILVLLVFITGVIAISDKLFYAPRRKKHLDQMVLDADQEPEDITHTPLLVEYARSFFPVLLIVLLLRSFIVEPFVIPSGSLEPTLLVGDFILVNKYQYGLRLPVLHTKILSVNEPKEGDIAVFRYPVNPRIDYIKRIIGVPGDHIQYIDKKLIINGQAVPQKLLKNATDSDEHANIWRVKIYLETINGVKHRIYVRPDVPARDVDVTVPEGSYFAMGDNRDDSQDSRYWGFVPQQNLLGRAFMIWMSWNGKLDTVRWDRIGQKIV